MVHSPCLMSADEDPPLESQRLARSWRAFAVLDFGHRQSRHRSATFKFNERLELSRSCIRSSPGQMNAWTGLTMDSGYED
ncbi:hypothetical protein MUK42_08428 [Musa troglodytarum]|uniref:Uncharacterized protein n=1 Tax=Musa troglodytarum TaxID=320322 RepID=A0A9E7J9H8_9LILI|nr:hypothetical protein MUK42_08428 [Musa troglodytarum]